MRIVNIHRNLAANLNWFWPEKVTKKIERGVRRVIDDLVENDHRRVDGKTSIPGNVIVWRRCINEKYPDFKPDLSYQMNFAKPEIMRDAFSYFIDFEMKLTDVLYGKKDPLMRMGERYADFVGLPNFSGEWRIYAVEQGKPEHEGLYATATLNKPMKKPWTREDLGDFAETYEEIDQGSTEYSIKGIPTVTKIPKIKIGKSFLEDDGAGIELFFGEAREFAEDILLIDGKDKERVKVIRKEKGFEGCITYSVPYGHGSLCAELAVK